MKHAQTQFGRRIRSQQSFAQLASSQRLAALLLKRSLRKNPTMALVEVAQSQIPPLEEKPPFVEPSAVLVTPCDPWPRPYYLEDGLRKVAPYHFTYNTYCKERWRGRELYDIFVSEFRDRPAEYYVRPQHLPTYILQECTADKNRKTP